MPMATTIADVAAARRDDLERNLLRLRQRRISCRDKVHVRSLDNAALQRQAERATTGLRPQGTHASLGINIGAFLGPMLTGLLAETRGFHGGFGLFSK